jgi:chromosome partitioning protein
VLTVAVANQKGGVGKTTTAISLAAGFSALGRSTLLLDLDPHACASIHLAHYPQSHTPSSALLFAPDANAQTWSQIISRRDDLAFALVPACSALADLEQELRDVPSKGTILRERLSLVAHQFQMAVLDCPPHLGVILINALAAANLILVPVQTDFLALHGLSLLFATVRTLERGLGRPLPVRVLPTMYDRRASACRRVLDLLRAKLGSRVLQTVISVDTKFREASACGQPILQAAPSSRGAQEYRQLAEEVLALVEAQ